MACHRAAMNVRVYLATTQGAVLIERISREPAPQSAICLKRTTKILPVSGGYDAFVRQPSGVIEREFGPFDAGGFRLDVSGEIADGESWQLGVFVAHALKESGRLCGPDDDFDEVWWLTGEVDNDLSVQAVAHIPDKIRAATDDMSAFVERGTPVTLFMAKENLESIDRAELPYGVRVVGVATTEEVLEGVGYATPPPTLELNDQAAPLVPWPERIGAGARGKRKMSAARSSSSIAVIGAGVLALAAILLLVFRVDLFQQPAPPAPVTVAISPPVELPRPKTESAAAEAPPAAQVPPIQPATVPQSSPSESVVSADVNDSAASPPAAEMKPESAALVAPATALQPADRLIEINVFGLFPDGSATCAAVHFGNAKTVEQTIGLESANTHRSLPIDDLCAIEIEFVPSAESVFVRAILDVEGGDFVDRQRWPVGLSGTQSVVSSIRWRGDLPKRLYAPLRYSLTVASATTDLSWLSDAMIRGSSATEAGTQALGQRGVTIVQRHHTIKPF